MKKNSTILTMSFALLNLLCALWMPISAQTAIGGNTPDPSAMLDVQSDSKGVLFPRMTTTQRNGIGSPAFGLLILNTETGCLEINLGTTTADWKALKCQTLGQVGQLKCTCTDIQVVNSPLIPGVTASGQSVIVPYVGGNGDLYDGQTVKSSGVTGLTATLAEGVFALGNGNLTYTITGMPSGSSGLAVFDLNVGGQTCTLNVPVGCGAYLSACDWRVFSCYNLGAVGEATSENPFTPSWKLIGDYYQWGYKEKAAPGPLENDPRAGDFSTFPAEYTWRPQENPDLMAWQDAEKTDNDPCPEGFRIPKREHWQKVIDQQGLNPPTIPSGASWTNSATNYTSGINFGPNLFLPSGGNRANDSGNSNDRGIRGDYWSSVGSVSLFFFNGGSIQENTGSARNYGMNLRCIKE